MAIRIVASIAIPLVILFIFKTIITDHDKCYASMEHEGHVAMECCGGLFGGTKNTEYLQEACIDCPYFCDIRKKGEEND